MMVCMTELNPTQDFELSLDKSRLDLDRIEEMIRTTYWASQRSRHAILLSIEHSLCLGAYRRNDGLQVGFARLVTDHMSFAWVSDVMVDVSARGQGIGMAMMAALTSLPGFEDVRFVLSTRDAHGLYEKYGFKPLPHPELWMIRAPEGETF
jgi:GNAT superfamily N-acetyltransferase